MTVVDLLVPKLDDRFGGKRETERKKELEFYENNTSPEGCSDPPIDRFSLTIRIPQTTKIMKEKVIAGL